MKEHKFKVSGSLKRDGKEVGKFADVIIGMTLPETLKEAMTVPGLGGEEGIVDLAVRDWVQNIGNTARAAGVAALDSGERDPAKLAKIVSDAAAEYIKTGKVAGGVGGGAALRVVKADRWLFTEVKEKRHIDFAKAYFTKKMAGDTAGAESDLITYAKAHGGLPSDADEAKAKADKEAAKAAIAASAPSAAVKK